MKRRLPSGQRRTAGRARGLVLLALLLVLGLSAIGMLAAAEVWGVTRQRERERQLLFAGDQYRDAIRRYFYGGPPGTPRILPPSLDALLEDDRFPFPVHHLRRLYPDPITGSTDWGLLLAGDRIMGVYSKSEAQPLKQAGFGSADQAFAGKSAYHDWIFAFVPGRRPGIPMPASSPAARPPLPKSPGSGNAS